MEKGLDSVFRFKYFISDFVGKHFISQMGVLAFIFIAFLPSNPKNYEPNTQ